METQKTVTIRATTREDYHKQLIMLFLRNSMVTQKSGITTIIL